MGVSQARAGLSLHPAVYIACWIFFSNLTILFNKWLISSAGFRYPVILTCWHMAFATLATQALARTTTLLDGRRKINMTRRVYLRTVVPIGILYSCSMVSSNLVYLYLSVPFVQMLKATGPVVTLFIGWLWGVEHPTLTTALHTLLIVAGVLIASIGEVHFSWPGFAYQAGGVLFESARLVMIQHLVSDAGLRMDPLVSLYYYAPVCALANLLVASRSSDWSSFEWRHATTDVGLGVLLLNAAVAFLLNVSSVLLIGKTSSLALVLTGILKNILLVAAAVALWGDPVAGLQLAGYGLALLGLLLYQSRTSWGELKASAQQQWAAARGRSRRSLVAEEKEKNKKARLWLPPSFPLLLLLLPPLARRRLLIVAASSLVATLLLIGCCV
ncbi:triose-phosphate transporter family-domain-containing protein [Camillea tinctor]|nr:triose-phosphate transporter family-domain-containing protein [Camillea tinctor]